MHNDHEDFDFGFDDEEIGGFRKIPKDSKIPRYQEKQKHKDNKPARRATFERKRGHIE